MERQRESGQTAARSTTPSGPRERPRTLVHPSVSGSRPTESGSRPSQRIPTTRLPGERPSEPLSEYPSEYATPRPTTTSRALVPSSGARPDENAPVIVAPNATRSLPRLLPTQSAPIFKPWMRLVAGLVAVVACIATVLGFQLVHPAALGDKVSGPTGITINGTPQPSGHGPITATIGVIVAIPPPVAKHSSQSNTSGGGGGYSNSPTYSGSLVVYGITSIQPCHDSYQFVSNITQWTTPPGCYANIYRPNPANYPARASWGWCNWWVEESHPQDPNVTGNTRYPRGTTPVANAAVFMDGGEQGASAEGHWVESIAVSPGGYWILIAEMNFAWRGAGFGLVDYRYIHVSPHVHFLYGV